MIYACERARISTDMVQLNNVSMSSAICIFKIACFGSQNSNRKKKKKTVVRDLETYLVGRLHIIQIACRTNRASVNLFFSSGYMGRARSLGKLGSKGTGSSERFRISIY